MSLWDHIKNLLGYLKITTITDASGKTYEIAVSVNSLAKRLHLGTKDAQSLLQKEGSLSEIASLSKTFAEEISKKELRTLPDLARNITTLVAQALSSHGSTSAQAAIGTINDHKYCVIKEDKKISLVRLNYIAEGGFGTVHSLEKVSETPDSNDIIKIAQRTDDKSIYEEFKILKTLNPNGKVEGLQLPSKSIVQIKQGEITKPGYIAPRYSGDMLKVKFTDFKTMQDAFRQLSNGVCELHNKGWHHGDIKPQNMLYKPGRYDIADLGGAMSCETLRERIGAVISTIIKEGIEPELVNDGVYYILDAHTPAYVSDNDIKQLEHLLTNAAKDLTKSFNDKKTLQTLESKITQCMQARDAYALGLSMLRMLVPEFIPPQIESSNYWKMVGKKLESLARPTAVATQTFELLKELVGPLSFTSSSARSITGDEYQSFMENRIKALKSLNFLMSKH